MTTRDFEAEKAEHSRKQQHAEEKIEAQGQRIKANGVSHRQADDDRHLLSEMRRNKAFIDFNRALFDDEEDHKDDRPSPHASGPGQDQSDEPDHGNT